MAVVAQGGTAMVRDHPYVTVAMITYNHEHLVGDAINSILAQTFDDFELVIVDDGSTDDTGAVARRFADRRIRYIRQENQGPSVARNTALREARGVLLAQMSGDDIAEPYRLERQLQFHGAHPNSVVFSHCVFIDDAGREVAHATLDSILNRRNWERETTLRHLFLNGNCFLAPSALADRNAFLDVGLYKPQLLQLQDYDMWVRFLLKGYDAFVVEEPLIRYRIRSAGHNLGSATGAGNRINFERRWIMREFLSLRNAKTLANVFPEIRTFGYPLDDELSAFLLACVALQEEFRGRIVRCFGADLLMELMSDPRERSVLHEKAGFRDSELFRILGDVSFRDAAGLQAQLDDIYRSRTWRLTKPFRGLASIARRWV